MAMQANGIEASLNGNVPGERVLEDSRLPIGERVGRLIRRLPGKLIYFDGASRIQGISVSALKEFGYQLGEVLGRPVTEFMPPEAAKKCRVRHPDFWNEGDMTLQLKVRRKSGIACKILASITFDFDDQGDVAGAIVVIEILSTSRPRPLREQKSDWPYGLTDREHEVLEAAATGKTSKQIGEDLSISHETVNRHIANALLKLNTSSRVGACVRGVQEGWLSKTH